MTVYYIFFENADLINVKSSVVWKHKRQKLGKGQAYVIPV